MTERSLPHQNGVGDGGPYSAEDWHLILETVALAVGDNVGIVRGILNELAVTSTGDNNITVNTGRALVEGVVYENDASESKTTNDPGGAATTGRRAVLRLDVAARTVRIAIITSADDVAALPALTQSAGVTWEIPLAGFQIDPTGAITELTDEREFTDVPLPFGRSLARAGATRWSMPGWYHANTLTNGSPTADVIHLIPILVRQTTTFDRIGVRVDTLAAGEVARLGIYQATLEADGLTPGALLLDAGTVSVAAAGDKEIVISQELVPGYYFLAIVDESGTPRYRQPDNTSAVTVPVTGVGALASEQSNVILLTDANAGADWPNNGLPDPAPAVTSLVGVQVAVVKVRDST